ncbi:hypothetical protein L1987_31871 [Smallanthus sonchifolius]|uniref:Uncharacterized protein n=1 Tax=Smallanthus sonchifolius TaxID=185202 RepID=A0ACB9I8B2_9ASTR|nr:hypothetical protein L1987_31871 [Smallanthus sonchifolius]
MKISKAASLMQKHGEEWRKGKRPYLYSGFSNTHQEQKGRTSILKLMIRKLSYTIGHNNLHYIFTPYKQKVILHKLRYNSTSQKHK